MNTGVRKPEIQKIIPTFWFSAVIVSIGGAIFETDKELIEGERLSRVLSGCVELQLSIRIPGV